LKKPRYNTRLSKTSDFGSGCSADGNLIIQASIFDALLAQLQKEGGYLANDAEKAALRKAMWDDEGHRLADTVADCAAKGGRSRRFQHSRRPQVHHRARRRHWQRPPVSHAKSSPHCWRFTSTARLTKP
jgi:hypothetical protein